jgi:8-oxo-dGTP pyrophosphatase MutT (NUDIX family)
VFPDSGVVRRYAGRVVLIDAEDRVLLFRGGDPAAPERGSWWWTPGGGREAGESAAAAAARELAEETGLRVDPAALGPVAWERVAEFTHNGRRYRQYEDYFRLRVDRHAVDVAGFTELERRMLHEYRWWSLDDLRVTSEIVYPRRMAELLPRLLAGPWTGPPERVGH